MAGPAEEQDNKDYEYPSPMEKESRKPNFGRISNVSNTTMSSCGTGINSNLLFDFEENQPDLHAEAFYRNTRFP